MARHSSSRHCSSALRPPRISKTVLVGHLALFDLDNTLVDRQAVFYRWAESFVSRRGLGKGAISLLCELDDDGFAPREVVFEATRQRWGLHESVEELVGEYRATYLTFYTPDPAVIGALDRLRQAEWRVGVVTNGPTTQHAKLELAGLGDLVDACCVSDEVGAAKPDRRIFEQAVLRCAGGGRPATSIVMVGDAPGADIGGGRAMGFRTIWMHRGRTWPLTDYLPDMSVASVAEAVDNLLAL